MKIRSTSTISCTEGLLVCGTSEIELIKPGVGVKVTFYFTVAIIIPLLSMIVIWKLCVGLTSLGF